MEFNIDAMTNRIMQWSNVNSGSFNVHGLERMSGLINQAFSELNAEQNNVTLHPFEVLNALGEIDTLRLGPLLSYRKRPEAPLQILLVAHMDTVFDLNHPFQTCYRKDTNTLIGPGVADMKGGICIMLEALKAFETLPSAENLGWEVLINPDEEIGSPGSAPFLAESAKRNHLGLIFEPAMDIEGTLAAERKGSAKFTILVKGRAAHAGRDFHLGRNAIVALTHVLKSIDALNGKREGLTINIGYIAGGGAVNIVPALALARLDIRYQVPEDGAWIQEQLEKLIQKAHEQEGFTLTLHGGISRTPKTLTPKTLELYELVARIGKELGQNITWKNSGGCSDGNNLSAAGLPNVDTLGVCGGNIHSGEEFMLIDSLEPRVQLTFNLLKHLSENGTGAL